MPQTVVEKIAQQHMTEGPERAVRAGDFVSLRPRHILTHDNTAAVIKKFKGLGAKRVFDPRQPVFALDHDIQNTSDANLKKYDEIEAFASAHGIDFYRAGCGIGHQLMIEKGYVLPGSLVVASDSHSNMYGAMGALGTPVVRTDAAAVWATGEFWWQIPPTVQVVLKGQLRPGVTGKDVILALCGLYNHDEVLNTVLEFGGPGTSTLTMAQRLTIANMTTEWGALAAWFPADEKTFAYLRRCRDVLGEAAQLRLDESLLSLLEYPPLRADADANYAARIELDLAQVSPCVSGPDSVQVACPVSEIAARRQKINKAYLLSCVNSRFDDLAGAARVLEGRQVAPGVKFYVAAASAHEQSIAEAKGVWATLMAAGAIGLPPGCGACIGLGAGLLDEGEVGISATNRNFKGRMGARSAQCYLASPETVAASAISGYICAADDVEPRQLSRAFTSFERETHAESVQILDGFPRRVEGRLVYCPQDNLNTDGIYGKDFTYREDMTPEMMAEVVMQNYDPQFASRVVIGDILVGGFNFGTGSSREQAVTALIARGIPMVIAASFSQTYLRNAFNNGFLCIESPELICDLRAQFAQRIAAERTIIPGDTITIDFASATATYNGRRYAFPALGSVPQSLVIAGGVENLVAQRMKAAAPVAALAATTI